MLTGYRNGPNAIKGAIERFEQEIFKRPALRATLEDRAARMGATVTEPPAKVTPAASTDAPAAGVVDDAARAAAAAAAAEEATRIANEILQNTETHGFLADGDGGTMHFFSEDHNAIVTIDAEGNKTLKMGGEDIIDEFLELQQKAINEFGETVAEIVPDGLNGVNGYFQGLNGGRLAKVLDFFGDAARVLGKTASVLGPVGMLAAGAATAAEVEGLYEHSDIARTLNIIPSDTALNQYYAILGAHATQATADPSVAAGELLTQKLYDEWCEAYNIPPEWREKLEPESLIELVFGDGSPHAAPNAAYNAQFHTIYDALPTEISEGMPPEVQALVEFKAIIEAENNNLKYLHGGDRYDAQQRLENAENMYTQLYDSMSSDGHIDFVTDYIAENSAVEPPKPEPDAEAPETRTAERTVTHTTTPTPM